MYEHIEAFCRLTDTEAELLVNNAVAMNAPKDAFLLVNDYWLCFSEITNQKLIDDIQKEIDHPYSSNANG